MAHLIIEGILKIQSCQCPSQSGLSNNFELGHTRFWKECLFLSVFFLKLFWCVMMAVVITLILVTSSFLSRCNSVLPPSYLCRYQRSSAVTEYLRPMEMSWSCIASWLSYLYWNYLPLLPPKRVCFLFFVSLTFLKAIFWELSYPPPFMLPFKDLCLLPTVNATSFWGSAPALPGTHWLISPIPSAAIIIRICGV